MLSFAEHLSRSRGSFIKARRTYIAERRWSAEDWYIAWQSSDLAQEVVRVADDLSSSNATVTREALGPT